MRRADRLFRIVQLLRSRRLVTAQELALELEVSIRTIYRDIRDLGVSGVPIQGEAGVGYSLHRGYELPPMTFNAAEIEALVLGARMVRAWGDSELVQAAASVISKVESVLPDPLKALIDDTALFAPDFGAARYRSVHLGTLRHAIKARRKVQLEYRKADGALSRRIVRPLGLYYWGTKWSVATWCELRQAYRNFRPDRIVSLDVTDIRFDDADGISLELFIEAMRASDRRNRQAKDLSASGGAAPDDRDRGRIEEHE